MNLPSNTGGAALRATEQHLRRILVDSRLMAIACAGLRVAVAPGYHRDLVEHFLCNHDEETLAANFAFDLAPDAAPQDAVLARRLTDRPAMQALMRASERLFIEMEGRPVKTPELQRMDEALERDTPPEELQAYGRVALLCKRVDTYFGAALRAHEEALALRFKALMQEMGRLSSSKQIDAAEIPTERLGFAPYDRLLDVFGDALHAQAAMLEQTARAARASSIDDVLEAHNLKRRATIRRGRRKLAQAEQIALNYLKTYRQLLARRAEEVRAAARGVPGFDEASLDMRMDDVMAYLERATANRLRQYAIIREMLAFAEARLEQGGVENLHLLFSTYADVEAWHGLGDDAERLIQDEENDMAARQEMQRRLIGIWKGRPERPRRGALRKLRQRGRSPARLRSTRVSR